MDITIQRHFYTLRNRTGGINKKMSMEEYTNRELGIMLSEMRRENEESSLAKKEILERIEAKVDKTNGRVTQLEKWRVFLAGGQAILIFLLPVITFLAMKWFDSYQREQDARTQQLINMAIEENNTKFFDTEETK